MPWTYDFGYDSEDEDDPRQVFGSSPPTRIPEPHAVSRATQAAGAGSQGVWTATVFAPPPTLAIRDPDDIFTPRRINTTIGMEPLRFAIRRRHVPALGSLKTVALFVDGACSDNGSVDDQRVPRAGCAFIFAPEPGGTVSFALERKGPDGNEYTHTSNRAELRAVIAALKFRVWGGEGWERVVIVTDSQYVGRHATGWLRKWAERGWRTSGGRPVKNRDLWEALSNQIGELARWGCEVSFWMVPRRWNARADAAAKAAVYEPVAEEFRTIHGVCV